MEEVITDGAAEFRHLSRRGAVVSSVIVIGVGAAIVWLVVSRPKGLGGSGDATVVLIAWLVVLGFVLALRRRSANVGPDGVQVTRLLTSRTFSWREVQRFQHVPGDKGGVFAIVDRAPVRLPTSEPFLHREEHRTLVLQQLESLRARYQPTTTT